MPRTANDPNSIAPPITDIPLTLVPIKRGAVIDWKATAVREHHQATSLAKINARLHNSGEAINRTLADTYDTCAKHYATISAIRAHWPSFLLPKELR